MANGSERMRREVMIRVVREFMEGTLEENIDRLPILVRPKGSQPSRCCIYHDREVLRYRLLALMGYEPADDVDESRSLKEYLQEAMASDELPPHPITVCESACNGCPNSKINITSNCQGCFARPCMFTCPKGAITVENQRATVDYAKCIKCGKCLTVCPFNAILKTTVPCEEICPVGAIRKNAEGVAEINFNRCIFCGKCFVKCPFGAILERSQLLKILYAIRSGKQVVALVAPSAEAQFPGGIERLFSAIVKAGFTDVIEVALGAEMTTENEAREYAEKIHAGQKLMTTSCCPAYVELVRKHYPDFLQYVSTTPSPMKYAGKIAREKYPEALNVFIGPCIAKRDEALHADEIDFVLTFEELGAIISGMKIDIMAQEPWPLPRPASAKARNYMKSCGVTEAVLDDLMQKEGFENFQLHTEFINGIERKTLGRLRMCASEKSPVNFVEGMSCTGGCVGGPCSLVK
ncbi:MAG: monomeric [FeFe] hydrogenase [Planctomycetia bacterium]|nr:monomeric [FeFe] hydrogenase [Planctomycetia bacterium]